MIRWILIIIVGQITLYAACWGAFLLWSLFSTDGQLIVAAQGTSLKVVDGGVEVSQGSAQAVGVTRAVLGLLVVWYGVLAILALAGVWQLTSRRNSSPAT